MNPPEGVRLGGGWIPAGSNLIRATLQVPAVSRLEPYQLRLEGRARLGGKLVTRPAVPCEDMMQAFAYRHLVSQAEWRVAVHDRNMNKTPVRVLHEGPVIIPTGGVARVRLNAPGYMFKERFTLELSEPPEGVTLEKIEAERNQTTLVLAADAAKARLGQQGNLIFNVMLLPAAAGLEKDAPKNQNARRKTPVSFLPAIPFEIAATAPPEPAPKPAASAPPAKRPWKKDRR